MCTCIHSVRMVVGWTQLSVSRGKPCTQDFLGKKFPSWVNPFPMYWETRSRLPAPTVSWGWWAGPRVLEPEVCAGPAQGQWEKHSPRQATPVLSWLLGLQPSTPTLSLSNCKEIILLHSQSKLFLGKSRIWEGNHIIREGWASSFVLFFRAAFGANNLSFLE